LPPVEEFDKEMLLAFEKELMGVYVSGHPLDDYISLLEKNVTAHASEFLVDDETGMAKVEDNKTVVVGGMITDVTIKYTKNNKAMAFITLEDLTGQVEVIVFPNSFEPARSLIAENNKVFISGRVQAEEEKDAKIICQDIKSFDDCKREIWIQFSNKAEYDSKEQLLSDTIRSMDGNDNMVIYLTEEKAVKRMPDNWGIGATAENLEILYEKFGEANVKVVNKKVQFASRRY
ncbi:MAG: DNA polymerase III subunit alpha, partial [Pseudobutyrivibrio sp.]|nr:DNA polymerase III subunit alpha [Pseudobutyrivibrio sp.]